MTNTRIGGAIRSPVSAVSSAVHQAGSRPAARIGHPDNYPPRIQAYVDSYGRGDYTLPDPPVGQGWRVAQLYAEQLTIRIPGKPARDLFEMPLSALSGINGDLAARFLKTDDPSRWATGWRWVFDRKIGVPVFVNTPDAIKNPRGIAVLLHGACTQKSGPHSLITPGGLFNHEGYLCVLAPKPFHLGFGPVDADFHDLRVHMEWLRDVVGAARDYFHAVGGEELPLILVGRSTGGNEVLEYAQRFPKDVAAVIAISPYHPEWGRVDNMMLRLAGEYGMAHLNDPAMRWNTSLDAGQWTFLGNALPFPTGETLSEEGARRYFNRASQDGGDLPGRRQLFRELMIAERLPRALKESPSPLIYLDVAAIRELFPQVSIPKSLPATPLSESGVPTAIYAAGPDLEYLAADSYHGATFALAARGNPNVEVFMAPFGDHDPLLPGDNRSKPSADAFQKKLFVWLDRIIPQPLRRQIEWAEKLIIYALAKERAIQERLPSRDELVQLALTNPSAVQQAEARKRAIVKEVSGCRGCVISHEDLVMVSDRATKNGYFRGDDRRVFKGLQQFFAIDGAGAPATSKHPAIVWLMNELKLDTKTLGYWETQRVDVPAFLNTLSTKDRLAQADLEALFSLVPLSYLLRYSPKPIEPSTTTSHGA